jgi:excisionase family DNA binding protein
MTKIAYGLAEAEQMTTISMHLLRKMVKNGTLRAARVGRRIVIPASELERLCKLGARISTAKKSA